MKRAVSAGVFALAMIGLLSNVPAVSAGEMGNSYATQRPVSAAIDIDRIRSVLNLTQEQERYWRPVEAALRERPMVVVYRVSPLTALLAKILVEVPYYSMVNLLAGKPVVAELLQSDFTASKLAGRVEYLFDHPEACEAMVRELRAIKSRLGPRGAIQRAAQAILDTLPTPGTTTQAA